MKSGLGDRNNDGYQILDAIDPGVSMKSGLGDRNNRSVAQNLIPTIVPYMSQ